MSIHVRKLLLLLLLGIASNYLVGIAILIVPPWLNRTFPTFWPSPGPVRSSFSPRRTSNRFHILTTVDFAWIERSANYTETSLSASISLEYANHQSIAYFTRYLQTPAEADLLSALRGVRLGPDEQLVSLGVTRLGWPCKSLTSTSIATINDAGVRLEQPGAPALPLRGNGIGPLMMPLAPLWPGFAINAICWAAFWALPCVAVPALLARRRAGVGECALCKYDLRGTSSRVCPECGREKPSAHA